MIVPVIVTAVILFPFLLYIVFAEEALIPLKIEMHSLTPEEQAKVPINPNIPDGRGIAEEQENVNDDQGKVLSLEEIMNPFVDKKGAAFGAVIMTATLVTLLAVNASDQGNGKDVPVFYITLPAAVVMFCWDLASGWISRKKTREISKNGRLEKERFRAEQARLAAEESYGTLRPGHDVAERDVPLQSSISENGDDAVPEHSSSDAKLVPKDDTSHTEKSTRTLSTPNGKQEEEGIDSRHRPQRVPVTMSSGEDEEKQIISNRVSDEAAREENDTSLVSLVEDVHRWAQETFPTCTAVLSHLPYALLPFAFSMFVLVQGLVTNGWVPVFAYGWDHVSHFQLKILLADGPQVVRHSAKRPFTKGSNSINVYPLMTQC